MKEWEIESYKSEREQIERKIEGLRLRLLEVEIILRGEESLVKEERTFRSFTEWAKGKESPATSILAVPFPSNCEEIEEE